MRDSIFCLLEVSPNLLGREIAKKLGKDRKEVNSFLNKNQDIFYQNNEYRWSICVQDIIIKFPSGWITAEQYENILKEYSNLFSLKVGVIFVFEEK